MTEQTLVERTFRFGTGEDSEEVTIEVTTDPKLHDGDMYLSIRNTGDEEGVTITPKYLNDFIVVLGAIQKELPK